MAGALEDTEVGGPGADGFTVLVGQCAGDLVDVGEVVDGPCREELGEGDRAKCGMGPQEG